MQKNKIDIADCVSVLLAGCYTVLIYYSNTPMGTKAQADFVAYYTAFMLLITFVFAWFDDELILRAGLRHPTVKAFQQTAMMVQLFLFLIMGHFVLFVMRLVSFLLMYARYRGALERASKTVTHT